MYFERLTVVTFSFAHVAHDVDIGQKIHFDLPHTVPFAALASSPLHVEAESSCFVSTDLRLGKLSEEVADHREHAGICCGVRTRCSSDRRLVDVDDLINFTDALERYVRQRAYLCLIEFF